MSIVRVGLAEKKKYADGYDAIFKKGAKKAAPPAAAKPAAKKPGKKK